MVVKMVNMTLHMKFKKKLTTLKKKAKNVIDCFWGLAREA